MSEFARIAVEEGRVQTGQLSNSINNVTLLIIRKKKMLQC